MHGIKLFNYFMSSERKQFYIQSDPITPRSEEAAKCAKGFADIVPSDVYFPGERVIGIEAWWKSENDCVWNPVITVTGPVDPSVVIIEGKTWDFPGIACKKQVVEGVKIISCNSSTGVPTGEGFGRAYAWAEVPQGEGEGEITLEDPSAGVSDSGSYTVKSKAAEVFLPTVNTSPVAVNAASGMSGTVFSWNEGNSGNRVIIPIVEVDANGVPIVEEPSVTVHEGVTTTDTIYQHPPINLAGL